MPYKIADKLPSIKATTVEIADFIEIECLKRIDLKFSSLSAIKSVDVADDYQEDEVDEDNFVRDNVEERKIDDAFEEIELRGKFCRNKYPFIINKNGIVEVNFADTTMSIIYIYLLMVTRLKMGGKNVERVFNGLDGTLLFEKLCEIILSNYWGEKTKSIIFGTSTSGGFTPKVNQLIIELKEGGAFKNRNTKRPSVNDDNLDVVVWKNFADERCSQLIGFAQCKTGDTWKNDLGQLNPGVFIDRWFSDSTSISPINIFMVADVVREEFYTTSNGLLFFDRCRLMDYLPDTIDAKLFSEIKLWLEGASTKYQFNTNLFE